MRLRSYGFFFTFPALFRKFYHDFAAIMRFSPLPTHFIQNLLCAWTSLGVRDCVSQPHRLSFRIEDAITSKM